MGLGVFFLQKYCMYALISAKMEKDKQFELRGKNDDFYPIMKLKCSLFTLQKLQISISKYICLTIINVLLGNREYSIPHFYMSSHVKAGLWVFSNGNYTFFLREQGGLQICFRNTLKLYGHTFG